MKLGYARVSTHEQNLDLQIDALKKAGCEKIFTDKTGGAIVQRPGLDEALSYLRQGDTLVVWRLDRLGRSTKNLIELIEQFQSRGTHFQSIQESIETESAGGRLVFTIFSALAQFERDLIKERTRAGLEAARARGRRGGRPPKMDEKKRAFAKKLYEEKKFSIAEICRMVGVSKPTLYKYIQKT